MTRCAPACRRRESGIVRRVLPLDAAVGVVDRPKSAPDERYSPSAGKLKRTRSSARAERQPLDMSPSREIRAARERMCPDSIVGIAHGDAGDAHRRRQRTARGATARLSAPTRCCRIRTPTVGRQETGDVDGHAKQSRTAFTYSVRFNRCRAHARRCCGRRRRDPARPRATCAGRRRLRIRKGRTLRRHRAEIQLADDLLHTAGSAPGSSRLALSRSSGDAAGVLSRSLWHVTQ